MRNIKKPNLFIVGAPKAGTTFLFENLRGHPNVFFPKLKELNFFSASDLKDSYYKSYRCKEVSDYLKHFKKVKEQKYIVDASVSYFTFKNTIEKIKLFNRDAKIIILIRNQIKRAFSHYQMDRRMGHATKSFEFYLLSKDSFHFKQYIENSLYFKYISEYINAFGQENVHVLILEKIENDIFQLCDKLDLDKKHLNNHDFSRKVNENKKPKNALGRVFQRNRNFASNIKLFLPKKVIEYINPHFYKKAEETKPSIKEMELLKRLFIDDINKLERLLKKDLKTLWKI